MTVAPCAVPAHFDCVSNAVLKFSWVLNLKKRGILARQRSPSIFRYTNVDAKKQEKR